MKQYFLYRRQAFSIAMNELFKQLQQFALMIVTLFNIFLPGLIAGLFFGIGKIVQSGSDSISMQVGLAFLIFQSLLITVLRPAILDLKHRTFHFTLLKTRMPQILSDLTALIICHVLFALSLILTLSMGIEKLSKAPHFILFMLAQLSFSIAQIYRQPAVIWSCLLGLVSLPFFDTPSTFFAGLNVFIILSLWLPRNISISFTINITPWTFWLSYFKNHIWTLTWRTTMSGLVFWLVFIIVTERPDLIHWYVLGGALLNQLWWSSLLIETSQITKKHALFWRSINRLRQIEVTQFTYLIVLSTLFTLPLLYLFTDHISLLMSVLVTPCLLILCRHRLKYLAVSWACFAVCLIMLMVIL